MDYDQLESVLLGGLLNDRAGLSLVGDLKPQHFRDHQLGAIFGAMCSLHGKGSDITMMSIVDSMESAHQTVNGTRRATSLLLSQLADIDPQLWNASDYSNRIQIAALRREQDDVLEKAKGGGVKPAVPKLESLEGRIEGVGNPAEFEVYNYGFRGARLSALRSRPEPVSPLPGLLDPLPSLHVLAGRPKSGKTTFALNLDQAWCMGLSPWEGAPKLPGTRALVISREQPVVRLDITLQRMGRVALRDLDTWTERLFLVARDLELEKKARRLLTLDTEGLQLLKQLLTAQAELGEPFGLLTLDSLSRLKPADVDENDNDGMSRWLDKLQKLAEDFQLYILLIHHVSKEGSTDPVHAGRGASAIGAVAQAVWLMDRDTSNQRRRLLMAAGNAIEDTKIIFEVASDAENAGYINYWKPVDDNVLPDKFLASGPKTITDIAWLIAGVSPRVGKQPSGAARRKANELIEHWLTLDLVVKTDNASRGIIIELKDLKMDELLM